MSNDKNAVEEYKDLIAERAGCTGQVRVRGTDVNSVDVVGRLINTRDAYLERIIELTKDLEEQKEKTAAVSRSCDLLQADLKRGEDIRAALNKECELLRRELNHEKALKIKDAGKLLATQLPSGLGLLADFPSRYHVVPGDDGSKTASDAYETGFKAGIAMCKRVAADETEADTKEQFRCFVEACVVNAFATRYASHHGTSIPTSEFEQLRRTACDCWQGRYCDYVKERLAL